MSCVCGHAEEEHGHDPKYPGSTSCQEDDCECAAYEYDSSDDDDLMEMDCTIPSGT
jgi:hypothetical protein